MAWAVVVLAVLVAILRLPEVQTEIRLGQEEVTAIERGQLENEYRRMWLQMMAGLVVIAGLYLTYRRIKVSEDANRINEQANREAIRVSEEGQVTERFTRATEQLGGSELVSRLGGIYSLERIARDSEKDHWTVMEILSTFIRKGVDTEESNAVLESGEKFVVNTDIQAALTVIGKREHREEPNELNLEGVWLRGYNLDYAWLPGVQLTGAPLDHASMWGATLDRALLSGTSFDWAHLAGASFADTRCIRTSFRFAFLHGAKFTRSHIVDANFDGALPQMAQFHNAYVVGSSFEKASFLSAQLTDCTFSSSSFDEARFQGTTIESSAFEDCTFERAVVSAKFSDTMVPTSLLLGADVSGAKIQSGALTETTCPDASFLEMVIDGVNYAVGMPDPRSEEWAEFAEKWNTENGPTAPGVDVQVDEPLLIP